MAPRTQASPERSHLSLYISSAVLLSLLVNLEFLMPNPPVPAGDFGDSPSGYSSLLSLHRRLIREGLNFWSPTQLSGVDAMANHLFPKGHMALLFLFPEPLAIGLLMFLKSFIGILGMTLLFSYRFKGTPSMSLLTGFLFLFKNTLLFTHFRGYDFMHPHRSFSIDTVPFLLYAIYRLKDKQYGRVVLFFLGALYSLFSAYSLSSHAILVVCAWLYCLDWKDKRSLHFPIAAFLLGWGVLEAPFLINGVASSADSTRYLAGSISEGPPMNLWRYFYNYVLITLGLMRSENVIFFLVIISALVCRTFSREALVMLSLYVIFVALEYVGRPIAASLLGSRLGMFGWMHFYGYTTATVCFAVLIGLILQTVHADLRKFMVLGILGVNAFVLFEWKMISVRGYALGRNYVDLFQLPRLARFAEELSGREERVVSVVQTEEAGEEFIRYLPPLSPWQLAPYGIESADGYVPVVPRRYAEYMERVGGAEERIFRHVRLTYPLRASVTWKEGCLVQGSPLLVDRQIHVPLLGYAAVSRVVSQFRLKSQFLMETEHLENDPDGKIACGGYIRGLLRRLTGPGMPAKIHLYQVNFPVAKYYLAERVIVRQSKTAVLAEMTATPPSLVSQTAVVNWQDVRQRNFPFKTDTRLRGGEILLTSKSADQIQLRIRAQDRGLLVAANNYSRGWRGEVDGHPAEVFPVNHTFQGILVEPGEHLVRLSYRPPFLDVVGRVFESR